MRKSILSASIAAMIGGLALAGAANAAVFSATAGPATATGLTVDNTGVGHILVVPYFTTQGGNVSLLNIVNTDTNNGKILKVRFRGASNSDDILDFQVFLSPGDAWVANIAQDPTSGLSKLTTPDQSCTVPAVSTLNNSLFGTARLNQALTTGATGTLAAETREGYIEILNMADVPKATTADQALAISPVPTTNPLFAAIAHTGSTLPTCTGVTSLKDPTAYSSGVAATAAGTAQGQGMTFPTGGLFANYTIVNVASTAAFSGQAVAVRAINGNDLLGAPVNAAGNLVFFPQSFTSGTGNFVAGTNTTNVGDQATPFLGVTKVSVNAVTSDPLLRTYNIAKYLKSSGALTAYALGSTNTAIIGANMVDLPDLSTAYVAPTAAAWVANPSEVVLEAATRAQAAALTASLAATSVVNEYLTTASIAAKNDWVFSMPTRRYNVAYNYGYKSALGIGDDGRVFTDYTAAGVAVPLSDVKNFFTTTNTSTVNSSISGTPQICVASNAAGFTSFDREETTAGATVGVSPAPLGQAIAFCGETSILAINNGTGSASGVFGSTVAFQNVNISVGTEGWLTVGTAGLNNATAAKGLPVIGASFAKSAAFGGTWGHRYVRP